MVTMLADMMDLVHENSVPAIESLQTRFQQYSDMFFMISKIFDPRYAFLFFSPLIFSLDWKVGQKVMWATIIAEWSNQILKWLLHGERPYWWIKETQVYNRTGASIPELQQYFLTCETGPGSPSGHSMVTAAVFYIIVEAFLKKVGAITENSKNLLHKACWLIYLMVLTTVGLSRVYIAAHFPHQCLMGMAIGFFVAMAMDQLDTSHLSTRHYVYLTAGLLSSAMLTFGSLLAMGMNPLWSVDRAVKWCAKQEYIHVDTTPFFSMMRYSGFLLGMGLGLNSKSFKKELSSAQFTTSMKLTSAVLAVGVAKLSEKIDLRNDNMALFYIQAFTLNTILPYVIIGIVPGFVRFLFAQKLKVH